jgi:hypothetical protein
MSSALFLQNVIAVVWDFDKTLIPGYMQDPLFRRYDVDPDTFWAEVRALPDFYRSGGLELVSPDSLYLNHILSYVRAGRFPDLTNAILRELGAELEFYPGVPEIFDALRARLAAHSGAARHEIALEHYVVSTGLRQTILGSGAAAYARDIWACEFVEAEPSPGFLSHDAAPPPSGPICQVGYALDNTTKTRAIFEINKGSNVHPEISVNSHIALEDRRVPFQNIVYVADGPSDVPVFSVVKGQGGRTYAVYPRGSEKDFAQANNLLRDGRVHAFGEADYRDGSTTSIWLGQAIDAIADRIAADRNSVLGAKVGRPPGHLV